MALESVGGALLSASLTFLFERIGSPELLSYLRAKSKTSDFAELLEKLKLSLISVTALLDDAENKLTRNTRGVEAWLDELQDAFYDADDALDEIETDALRHKAELGSAVGASRMKKARVRDVFSCFCSSTEADMERKIKKIVDRLEGIAKQKDHLGLREGSNVGLNQPRRLPSTSLMDESEVYGRDDDRNLVTKFLFEVDEGKSKIGVIPIVGMGGIGKTTLAQLVYNDEKVTENFELKAWICVSENLDVCGVTKTILEAVTLAPCSITDLNLLQVSLKDVFQGKRFLIVLDDMWNENYEDWKLMARPFEDGAQGSKIIVTTRSERVAEVMRTAPIHRLKVLMYDNCLALFMKHAFGVEDFAAHADLEAIGREIVGKCKGLPLAAKTLGGLLRSKLNIEDWEMVLKSKIWDFPDTKSNILPALRLSYHYLPSHLKRCFAYCSMFPKNYEFKKDQMILLWMAENLLQSPGIYKRIEEVGEEYFNDLVSRSFFQRSMTRGSFSLWHSNADPVLREEETTNNCIYLMHDLMHDLAKYVSREYCLQLEDGGSSGTMKKVRHLAYISTSDDFHKRLCYALEASRLRTFLPVLHYDIKDYLTIPSCKIVHDLLLNLKCLRVLSLSRYKNIDQVLDSIGELRHLRYLDLSHTNIRKLPESMCLLYNLQTLKLNSCKNLRKLPTDFHNLINLRYLDVRCCNIDFGDPVACLCDVVETPKKMSKLKSLQMLSTFVVGKDSGSRLGELSEHSDLQGELRIKGLECVVHAKDEKDQARLMEKRRLEALALEWKYDDCNDTTHAHDVLDMLIPNRSLKKLKIDGYSGLEYPNWFRDDTLSNIVFLELRGLRNCSSLPPLGHLPLLKTLDISGFDAVVNVGPEFYGHSSASDPFSSLEILKFTSMSSWEQWNSVHAEDSRTFTRLRELQISYCNKLIGDLPALLPSLTKLTIRCKKFASKLPRVPIVHEIEFGDCENEQQFESFSEALEQMEKCPQHLRISSCSSMVRIGHLPSTVEKLDISFCKDLEFPSYHPLESLNIRRCCDSLVSFPLESFPKLKDLNIYYFKSLESISNSSAPSQCLTSLTNLSIKWCPSFVSFPNGGISAPNLTHLVIDSCKRLNSLPEKMHTLLPSLQSLSISDCPEITSFPQGGLPLSLRSLDVKCCDKLIASRMTWNLQRLFNLKKFRIIGISRYEETEPVRCVGSRPARYQDVQAFPEEELLPATLSALWISKFPCLKSLDKNGLQKLTSLKYLCIFGCPKLQIIPKDGLPSSLRHLEILGCPMLEKKCQKKNGEYWSKINHIKTIHIGDEYF